MSTAMAMALEWEVNARPHIRTEPGPGESAAEFREYRRWRAKLVVGPPRAGRWYTAEELEEKGIVGLYRARVVTADDATA